MRWFTVTATKSMNSQYVQYDAVVTIQVYAISPSDAMKRVRPDFRFWHLEVE